MPQIEHADIAAFADASVNLPSEDAKHGRERVQRLRDRLERYINEHPDFSLVKMLHAGSVAKGTALRTLNDMDVAVYVRHAEAPSDAQLLNWLTERLREAYDGVLDPSQITPGHHCVTVTFKSEGGLNVDVVPVLYEGDADDRGYLVAKDTGDKLLTSVRLHLEFVRARKDANADFAQIVRLVKWWVRNQQIEDPEGFKFKSFMVELVVAKLADDGQDLRSYPEALKAVFTYILNTGLRERIAFADYYKPSALPARSGTPIEIYDPVNPQNNVAFRYTETQRVKIVDAADVALSAILEAEYATTRGRAADCWKQVLGSKFRG